jgi:hypothetical protein
MRADNAFYRISLAWADPFYCAVIDVAAPVGYRWHRAIEYRPTGRSPADALQAAITGIKISPKHKG